MIPISVKNWKMAQNRVSTIPTRGTNNFLEFLDLLENPPKSMTSIVSNDIKTIAPLIKN
jgi:hypothetical protein